MSTRAALIVNFGPKRGVPSDIAAKLREDLLETGVYVNAATISEHAEDNVVTVLTELVGGDDPAGVAQKALNEKYGPAPSTNSDEEFDEQEDSDDEDEGGEQESEDEDEQSESSSTEVSEDEESSQSAKEEESSSK